MELIISILMFFGLLSPEQATSMSDAELQACASANQQVIQEFIDTHDDPYAATNTDFLIDRRED